MAKTRRMNHEGCIVKKVVNGKTRYEWRQMVDGVMRTRSADNMPDLTRKIQAIKDLPVVSGKVRVSEWNKKWLAAYVTPLKRKATAAQYEYMIRHVDAVIGKRYMQSIRPSDIQTVIAAANANGLATKTMKHIRNVMHLSFEQAKTDRVVGQNPVVDIQVPRKGEKGVRVLTPAQMDKIMSRLEKSRWGPSVRFVLETGLRKAEMLALRWSDIDIEKQLVRVERALEADGSVGDTKNTESRNIPLSAHALEALQAQVAKLKKDNNPVIFRSTGAPDAWVFPTMKGTTLRPNSYYTTIARAGEHDGIKASPHMLRHTFVYVTRGKISLKDLQDILGHSESTSTLDLYGDMLNDKTDEMASTIDQAFAQFDADMKNAREKREKRRKTARPALVADFGK